MDNETTTNTEMLSTDEIISTLNGLIETCKDGQEGFETSAENVKDSSLQMTFQELSAQRERFAGELRSLVSALGGDPENSGSLAGTLHRGWLNLKAAVTGGDDGAILNECERGEDVAKDTYRAAMEKALPGDIAQILTRQNNAILEAHRKIKALRDGGTGDMADTATAS